MTSKKELKYQIEALRDEIDDLEYDAAEKHSKLWEIIQENDRLTLAYEPYRPPGDEDEGVNFYDLIEENKDLRAEIAKLKMELWLKDQTPLEPVKKKRVKYNRYWNFNFEVWPTAWSLNSYRYNWKKVNSSTREGSFQLGPFGFSWYREPKS